MVRTRPQPASLMGRNTARGHVDQTGDHVIEPFAPLRIRDLHRRRRRRPATIEHENIDAAHPRESVIDESVKCSAVMQVAIDTMHSGAGFLREVRGRLGRAGAPADHDLRLVAGKGPGNAVAEAACRGEDECAFFRRGRDP